MLKEYINNDLEEGRIMTYTFIFDELKLAYYKEISDVIEGECKNFKSRIYVGDLLLLNFGYEEKMVRITSSSFQTTKVFNKDKYQNAVGQILLSLDNFGNLNFETILDLIVPRRDKAAITIRNIDFQKAQRISQQFKKMFSGTDLRYEGYLFINENNKLCKQVFIDDLLLDSIFNKDEVYLTEESFLDFFESGSSKVLKMSSDDFSTKERELFDNYRYLVIDEIVNESEKINKYSTLYNAIFNGYYNGAFKDVEEFEITLKDILQKCNIPKEKLESYLLNLDHPHGKEKAKFFANALEITLEDCSYLENQILKKIDFGEFKKISYVKEKEYEFLKFVAEVEIEGKNGRHIVIDTVWKIENGVLPILITAYPTHKKSKE
ncbi:DUF6883 domain-containing protein [Bacillus cereus]|uniref:DUF6883 domain-containing protein n=1 Tax=Bacillus cereus TaxID=1396 RepID=A0A2A8ZYK0_BACCE|nr:DUF6883 domain-containing protein [Bacillus cereus]PFE14045.1 hypothetical protein CN307_17595 [Bacillus cereus]